MSELAQTLHYRISMYNVIPKINGGTKIYWHFMCLPGASKSENDYISGWVPTHFGGRLGRSDRLWKVCPTREGLIELGNNTEPSRTVNYRIVSVWVQLWKMFSVWVEHCKTRFRSTFSYKLKTFPPSLRPGLAPRAQSSLVGVFITPPFVCSLGCAVCVVGLRV